MKIKKTKRLWTRHEDLPNSRRRDVVMSLCLEKVRKAASGRSSGDSSHDESSQNVKQNPGETGLEGPLATLSTGEEVMVPPGAWVRPLGSMESFMANSGYYGTMNTVQAIWLSSTVPVKSQDVASALRIVATKMPHLQLVVQKRAGRSWFRRMRCITIDFQSSIGDVMTEYNAQVEMPYKMSKGPLWRARLVFPSVSSPRKEAPPGEAEPSQGPQQADRYKATLIVSTQHVITDGTSNMVMCQEFLNVLNALLNQQPICLARYPFIKPITDRRVTIDAWPSVVGILLKKLKTVFIRDFTKKTSFNGLLPVPRIKQHSCRVLRHDFSEDASSKLLKLSRASNVTINSCILAAANLAMFETARKRSTKGTAPLNSAFLTSVNCVNTRRYLPADHKRVPGCHIAMQETETQVTTSDFKDVWGLAKRIHTFIQNDIEVKKSPIKLTPMYRPAVLITIANHLLTKHSRKNRTDCHFTTTNMGNLKQLLPGEGSPVEIVDFLRSVSAQLVGCPFMMTLHTFRGRLQLSIDYFPNKITDEVAKDFFNTLVTYIDAIIDQKPLVNL